MNYIRSLSKKVYEKVVQDQYLEQLSQQQLYFIINNSTRKRNLSAHKDIRKLSTSEPQKDLFEKVDMIGNVSPQRQFRILGVDPKLQLVAARAKDLNQDLQQVTELMKQNFHKYERKINHAIEQIDNIKNMYAARKCSRELRQEIKKLSQATQKSKRITQLHIKKQNIKLIQKTLLEIPNLKKMTLTQLKSINIQNLKNRSILGKLKCLQGLQQFIEGAVAAQLTQVLHILQQCLTNQFDEKLYENALRDFIVAQHQIIKYEKLLIKLIQKQIRKIDSQFNNNIYQICQFYIRLLINLHGVFRWHRLNQKQQKWQQLSKGCYGISIQIDINNVRKKIIQIMDECLKDIILQKIYFNQDRLSQNLQNIYYVCRISQIAYTFSGQYFEKTLKQTTQYQYKKLIKLKDKASIQLQQTLKNQQRNNWNRLPVVDDYSHQVVDKQLYQIYRHRNKNEYVKIIEVLRKSKDMFKDTKIYVMNMGQLVSKQSKQSNLWDSLWVNLKDIEDIENKLIKKQSGSSTQDHKSTASVNRNKSQNVSEQKQIQTQIQSNTLIQEKQKQQQQQIWEIDTISFPFIQKYEKYKSQIKLKTTNHYTIICQYSLNILKYMEVFIKHSFYFPVQPILSISLNTISLTLQYYIYHIFNSFLSTQIKFLFFQKYQNLSTLQQRYHKKRLHFQYPTVTKFITNFKAVNKLTLKGVQYQNNTQNTGQQKQVRHSHSLGYNFMNSSKDIKDGSSNLGMSQQINMYGNSKQNLITRSRVVALQSFSYLIEYYQHIMTIVGFLKNNKSEQNANTSQDKQRNKKIYSATSIKSINQNISHNSLADIHPEISNKISQKISLYRTLFAQLSQLIYTDCIPKLCNLKNTHQLIQSIKWNDQQHIIYQFITMLSKTYAQFFYKMNSASRGQVPLQISQRLFGVYWKTQLTAIMKAFTNNYKIMKTNTNVQTNSKHKLQKFIDQLYNHMCALIKQKQYLRVPYDKIKSIFPMLMQRSWENLFEMLKGTLERYQFIYAIEMGIFQTSESCCYLGKEDLLEKRKIIEDWIFHLIETP